jgi:hypothetical protein
LNVGSTAVLVAAWGLGTAASLYATATWPSERAAAVFMVLSALHQLSHSAVHMRLLAAMEGSVSVRGDGAEQVLKKAGDAFYTRCKLALAAFTCVMLVLAPVAFVALDPSELRTTHTCQLRIC